MAKGGKDEHRMLFDLRGRRKNVVKVVYAILAVLMGLSLLLVIGPAPLADIFGTGNAVSDAAKQYEEQAERIEVKLVKEPEDPALLANLTRARINAANQLSERNEATGEVLLSADARQQLEEASSTWDDYLEATTDPNGALALLMANSLFSLAQSSPSGQEAEANIQAAAKAQRIVSEDRPNVNSLTTFALYALYSFEHEAAEKAIAEAKKLAVSNPQRQEIEQQYKTVEKRAKEFEAEQKERKKLEKELPNVEKELGTEGANRSPLSNALSGGSSLSE